MWHNGSNRLKRRIWSSGGKSAHFQAIVHLWKCCRTVIELLVWLAAEQKQPLNTTALFGRLVQRLQMVSLLGARRRGIEIKQSDCVNCFTVFFWVLHPSIHPSIPSFLSTSRLNLGHWNCVRLSQQSLDSPPPPVHQCKRTSSLHPWVHVLGLWEVREALGENSSPALESNLKCYPKNPYTKIALKCLQFIKLVSYKSYRRIVINSTEE